MPVLKKEHTTSETKLLAKKSPVPNLPRQEEFHQDLRAQIREATRLVMEEIMREELTQFLGAEGGRMVPRTERVSQRKLYA